MTDGNHIYRNGRRIEVAKQENVFTVLTTDEGTINGIRQLEGVEGVRPLEGPVVRVDVQPEHLDSVMQFTRDGATVSHHAYHMVDAPETRIYLTDQIVVGFGATVPTERIEKILADHALVIIEELPGTHRYLLGVTTATGENPVKAANKLAALDEVEHAEPNLINRIEPYYRPLDPYFPQQWHLSATAGVEVVAGADISAPTAWDTTRGDRSIVVAVIDDGFDLSHPDLGAPGKVVNPRDFIDGDVNPFPVTAMGDYHGTPCAGVAVAEENGTGVVGAAPDCSFMPVRIPLSLTDSQLAQVFEWVGARADVLSNSWGPPPVFAPMGFVLAETFARLAATGGPRGRGCVIVFAAGNYNAPLNDPTNIGGFEWNHPQYGLRKTTGPIENGFAVHPGVIAVSASTSQNRKAAYSNWGAEIAVSAPSNNFHPIDRQVRVPGRGIVTTDNEPVGQGFTSNSRWTNRFGGTSSACPLVAGVAALVLSANPELTAAEVKDVLQSTADKIADPSPDPVLGRTDAYNATGRSLWFGYGKVNAAAAVAEAVRRRTSGGGTPAPDEVVMTQTVEGSVAGTGDSVTYRVTFTGTLEVVLSGAVDNLDLYAKAGSTPTRNNNDAASTGPDSNEAIILTSPTSMTWFLMVRSFRGAGPYRLAVTLRS